MKNEKHRRSPFSLIRGPRSLEIFNSQYVLCTRTGNSETYKFLSPASVNAAFRNAPIDTGWLPPNIIRCGSTPKADFALLFLPSQKHTIQVEADRGGRMQELTLTLPAFIFLGFGRTYSLWAIKGNKPSASAQLFHAPLPNIFGNDAICWGSNRPPRASTTTLNQAWQLFISSPFNGHAATGKAKNYRNDVRPLLRAVAKQKSQFPNDELLPTHRTLDATISNVLGADPKDD